LISLIPTHIYPFALQKCAGRTYFLTCYIPAPHRSRPIHCINKYHTCITLHFVPFFVCIPIPSSHVYRSGAFGWIGVSRRRIFALAPHSATDFFAAFNVHSMSSCFLSLLTPLHIALYHYIYCSIGCPAIAIFFARSIDVDWVVPFLVFFRCGCISTKYNHVL